MDLFRNRRLVVVGGMGAALAAGLLLAWIMAGHGRGPAAPPPASQGGLVVQTGRDDDIKLDPRRPLRCFVAGRFVGELPLSDCARRNGVATGALDVGLDPSGALAATNGVTSDITPLPPSAEPATAAPAAANAEQADASQAPPTAPRGVGACWSYRGAQWSRLPGEMSLTTCVQSLYGGECLRPGAADYGRWGERTLRLLPGRVEISPDNRNFRLLVEQTSDCSLPPAG